MRTEPIEPMHPITVTFVDWKTWHRRGVKFIGFENGRSWHVFDEYGWNYGAWMTLENFHKAFRKAIREAKVHEMILGRGM